MNRFLILSILVAYSLPLAAQNKKPTAYVNPFIGTDFHGHTYPGATAPFGMVQLSPDTRLSGWDGCSGYHYSDSLIYGFSHTHLSGTGCSDYGDILIAPYVAEMPQLTYAGYASTFLKKNEIARAGYYSVLLDKYKVKAELTATPRVGFHRYTFKTAKNAALALNLAHRDRTIKSWVKFVNSNEIHGYRSSSDWAKEQELFFVIQFSEPYTVCGVADGAAVPAIDSLVDGARYIEGTELAVGLCFPKITKKQLLAKVALSAVSEDGAMANMKAELNGWNFDEVVGATSALWDRELAKIQVHGGTEAQRTNFYTALYHSMVVPNIYSDVDGQYRGMDGNVHVASSFTPYTVFSLWDTYRAWHPLMTIIDTKRTADYINTFLAHYQQGGRLPVWELSANETDCMIGYHSVSVITDAWMKGIRGFDPQLALRAMKHSATLSHLGLKELKEYNFIPGDMEHESVSKTLEYAYDDWCIAQMAKELKSDDDYKYFIKRAQAYKNLFDPETRLMRPRINGGWKSNFNPAEVDQHFTEANSWQYSFYVPHDISGLIALHGGADKFEVKLDELFSAPSALEGRNQVDITGLIGQYAHGNEPSHHMAYLYNYVGKPWKTQQRVRQILDEMYKPTPAGICGNEDCGQMSAWYVLSAMGFYPVCPGSTHYAIGTPLFDSTTINLENGKRFSIVAQGVSAENIYIESATLNGKPLLRSFIDHSEIMAGGVLRFKLGSKPNEAWAITPENSPSTMINDHRITIAPAFSTSTRTFTDRIEVEFGTIQPDATVFYTVLDINNPTPTPQWQQGNKVSIDKSAIVKIYSISHDGVTSAIIDGKFIKVQDVKSVNVKGSYSTLYTGGGHLALVDGIRGSANFRLGTWQGYQGQDFEAVVDLGEEKPVTYIGAGFLQDFSPWIMMPIYVEFSISNDNQTFNPLGRVTSDINPTSKTPTVKEFGVSTTSKARYIKVFAKSFGELPKEHLSAGEQSWLFIDEIVIK